MITASKSGKLGLLFLSVLLVMFGIFVFTINVTLLYKGKNAIEVDEVELEEVNDFKELNDALETRKQTLPPKAVPVSSRKKAGEEIGQLYIPKLNIVLPVFHGTSERELVKGVGHVIGTALPGENNNTVLTGHRDTVFRKIGEVKKGDILKVENEQALYTYKVRKTRIVDADDTTVIVPKRTATLTVSTCYPFTYIGPAKQRYVLVADLISSKLKRT
ncbi:class D sortase [Anaerobacillus arseniciselenatis]|uniref:class D sortase n=1 Tax=Anaerobacillus arseniciselenatis TaxID=85682 RepID=UPI000A999DFB|nr:class D sortase [Anaerobacillus arseniciselenatis]